MKVFPLEHWKRCRYFRICIHCNLSTKTFSFHCKYFLGLNAIIELMGHMVYNVQMQRKIISLSANNIASHQKRASSPYFYNSYNRNVQCTYRKWHSPHFKLNENFQIAFAKQVIFWDARYMLKLLLFYERKLSNLVAGYFSFLVFCFHFLLYNGKGSFRLAAETFLLI